MDQVLRQITTWREAGRPVTIVRVVAMRGVSGQQGTPLAALTAGEPIAGTVLSGAVDAQLAPVDSRRLLAVMVDDAAAGAAGMSCGGAAQLLLQPVEEIPAQAWQLLAEREPLCLVTELDGATAGTTAVHTRDTIEEAEQRHPGVAQLFNRGASTGALVDDDRAAVTALWPVPMLVVVGDGLIAEALTAAAGLLGWRSAVVTDPAAASAAVAGLARCDGVVVLSHDLDLAGPALATALAGRAGYLGALGSRRTQQARAGWLAEQGVVELSRIHGPAGLDLDARTPAEIAVSIVAELLAQRTGRAPLSLRERRGPVHADGPTATPPRPPG